MAAESESELRIADCEEESSSLELSSLWLGLGGVMKSLRTITVVTIAILAAQALGAGNPPLKLIKRVQMPGIKKSFDHLTADPKGDRQPIERVIFGQTLSGCVPQPGPRHVRPAQRAGRASLHLGGARAMVQRRRPRG